MYVLGLDHRHSVIWDLGTRRTINPRWKSSVEAAHMWLLTCVSLRPEGPLSCTLVMPSVHHKSLGSLAGASRLTN